LSTRIVYSNQNISHNHQVIILSPMLWKQTTVTMTHDARLSSK